MRTMSNIDLEKQFQKEIRKFAEKSYKDVQEALDEESDSFMKTLESATPVGKTGRFRAGWKKKKYPNEVYIHNGPMANISEYSARGPKPFIISLFQRNESSIKQSLIRRIQKKIRRK